MKLDSNPVPLAPLPVSMLSSVDESVVGRQSVSVMGEAVGEGMADDTCIVDVEAAAVCLEVEPVGVTAVSIEVEMYPPLQLGVGL